MQQTTILKNAYPGNGVPDRTEPPVDEACAGGTSKGIRRVRDQSFGGDAHHVVPVDAFGVGIERASPAVTDVSQASVAPT